MKRFGKFLAIIIAAVSIMSMTVFANETCSLAETAGGSCEIWWMFDNNQHWRACVAHRDSAGNDTIVTEPVAHEFKDGICTVCERPEPSGFLMQQSYWVVIAAVAGMGYFIVMKYKPKKLGRDEVTTFGLDKFRKFR